MQAAGHFITTAAKFTAGMQHGQRGFQCAFSRLFMNANRYTAPIILHGDAVILMNDNGDIITEPGQSFVDTVVHDLINEMVQTTNAGTADIHTRTAAHALQTLQDLNLPRIIIAASLTAGRSAALNFLCHANPPHLHNQQVYEHKKTCPHII